MHSISSLGLLLFTQIFTYLRYNSQHCDIAKIPLHKDVTQRDRPGAYQGHGISTTHRRDY